MEEKAEGISIKEIKEYIGYGDILIYKDGNFIGSPEAIKKFEDFINSGIRSK